MDLWQRISQRLTSELRQGELSYGRLIGLLDEFLCCLSSVILDESEAFLNLKRGRVDLAKLLEDFEHLLWLSLEGEVTDIDRVGI